MNIRLSIVVHDFFFIFFKLDHVSCAEKEPLQQPIEESIDENQL